ncbi:MAG: hypothetical protein JO340_16865 [Acidobacteriaceae bacterium]|nr:hypothetical protein [Acidobacteriaceae bacterium]
MDTVFITGLLVNTVKLADLLLLAEQQKRLQEWSEAATIRMDDFRPLAWFQALRTPRASKILLLIGVLEFAVVGLIAGGVQAIAGETARREQLFQILALVLSGAFIPFIVRRAGPRTMQWLLGDSEKPLRFIRRFLGLLGLGFAAFGLYEAILWVFFHGNRDWFAFSEAVFESRSREHFLLLGGLTLCWPFFTFFWIVMQVGGLALWCIVFLAVAELVLKFLRACAWRIVEYNKGAFAAITLIVTAVVGIVDFLLKSRHPK